MKLLTEYIKENNLHLRNIFIEINEELRKLIESEHSRKRKFNQSVHTGMPDISINEIKELIKSSDSIITNKLLNNDLQINTHKDQIGIRKRINNNLWLAIIFEIIYFNHDSFEYDVKLITCDKYRHKFNFKENTKLKIEIINNYTKEI